MIFAEKAITLKNGKACALRSPTAADAGAIMACLKTCAGETDFIVRYPEECTETDEQEAAYLEGINASSTGVMIVCFVDGEVAGNCQLICNKRLKTKHRASLAISVARAYWDLGIGTAMMRELIALAREKGVTQMELAFVEGNARARALYEKMGFAICGVKPNAVRLKDGTMLAEYSMIAYL